MFDYNNPIPILIPIKINQSKSFKPKIDTYFEANVARETEIPIN